MTDKAEGPSWRIIGRSVRGASHVRDGLPNQDAIRWWPKQDGGKRVVLSVSDGHGSRDCFRSRTGAYFSVRVAEAISKSLLCGSLDALDISKLRRWSEENFPKEIVRQWVNVVADAISREPFTREELKTLEVRRGMDARRKVVMNPVLAYGATLLTVLITEIFIVFLQLGDGDILVVSEEGEVMRPLPKDQRLFASETTSLCLRQAWNEFRFDFQRVGNSPPALILLSTDGYSNSFASEEEFIKIGPDILYLMRLSGLENVDNSLESWLNEASRQGSGDDITLGIICRADFLKKKESPPDTEFTAPSSGSRVDKSTG